MFLHVLPKLQQKNKFLHIFANAWDHCSLVITIFKISVDTIINHNNNHVYPLLLQLTLGVDCEVDEWSSWTPCSLTCGGGTKNRTKDIVRHPENGGAACPKDLDETEDCKCIGSMNHATFFPLLGLGVQLTAKMRNGPHGGREAPL